MILAGEIHIMNIILALTILLTVYVINRFLHSKYYIEQGYKMAEKTIAFSRDLLEPELKILVVGDSTGLGVGASSPDTSVTGMVAKRFPKATIHNRSINGAKAENVIRQLKRADDSYDLVMIHVSGNDVVKMTAFKEYEENIQTVLALAKTKGKYIVLIPTGNLGTIRIFPLPVRWLLEYRTKKIRVVSMKAVALAGERVRYVDFFVEKNKDPFYLDPEQHFAMDHFHPSDTGYAQWIPGINQALDYFKL